MNVHKVIEVVSAQYPQKPAIIFKEQEISFFKLRKNVIKLTQLLRSSGVNSSDKVAIYLPNCPEYIYSYLACFCLGAVVVPLDYMLKTDEMMACLEHSESKILIAQENPNVSLRHIKDKIFSLKTLVLLSVPKCEVFNRNEFICFYDEALQSDSKIFTPTISETDPALIMYTSGTTGSPKGILLNYKHLEGSPRAMEHFVDLSSRDVKLCALPLSHIAGLIYIQNCIMFGITLVLMDRFSPVEFLRNIEHYKVTCFHIVPAMYIAILSLKQIENFNLSSLRWVVVFGAPSSPDVLRKFQQYCPKAQLLNGWGMTETCPPNTVTPIGSEKIESVGKSSGLCEIKICDEADNELPWGEIGEIVIRGWVVMVEYYKDPATTAQLKRNGWFHTGDLGYFDEEGFLYIVGRKKEMIKVGGQIVYAPEVEAALHKHEAVAEVAVVGVPDKLRGEAVKAFIVIKEGQDVTAEDLRYFAREHLAHFKIPHTIDIKESLPKNRTGKVDKELLKQKISI